MKREAELTAIMHAMEATGSPPLGRPLAWALTESKSLDPAPGLALPDLDGHWHDLADHPGTVMLVNFWSTWCRPCAMEMPAIVRLARKMRGSAFKVFSVVVGDDPDRVRLFRRQLGGRLWFPLLQDMDAGAMEAWNVRGLPSTFLVDRRGRIAYTAVGGRDFDHPQVEHIVRTLMQD